jgi:hypothetical protein
VDTFAGTLFCLLYEDDVEPVLKERPWTAGGRSCFFFNHGVIPLNKINAGGLQFKAFI